MAEPGAAGFVVLQNRGADGAIGQPHRRLGGRAGDGGDHGDREALAGHRGDGEQVYDLTGQPGQAAGQHVTHRRRDTGHRGPVKRRTLRREQPRDLLGEERVPGGAVVHGADQRRRRALTAHLFDQLANLIGRQAGELQHLGLPGQLGQQPARGMIPGRHLDVAVRPDDEGSGVMQLAGEEDQQPQRRHVRPVQIIDDDNQRPLRRSSPQIRRRRVVGAEADRGLIAQDAAPGCGGAGELGQHGLARLAAAPGQTTHHLDPRPEARGAVALPARPPHGDRALRLRVGHRLGGERGLAHAGLARKQHNPARTRDGGIDGRTQRAGNQPPPDKHVRRHTPILARQATPHTPSQPRPASVRAVAARPGGGT